MRPREREALLYALLRAHRHEFMLGAIEECRDWQPDLKGEALQKWAEECLSDFEQETAEEQGFSYPPGTVFEHEDFAA